MEKIQSTEVRDDPVDPEEWPYHWYYTYLLPDLEKVTRMGGIPW
jgi:hypothetical protein